MNFTRLLFAIGISLGFAAAPSLGGAARPHSAKSATLQPHGQLSIKFSKSAGDTRSFFVVLPAHYSKAKRYKLVLVFPGTDTTGKEMHDWMGKGWSSSAPGLESQTPDTIFIYPDPKWRWDGALGWALGPYAAPYDGNHDLKFTEELLAYAKRTYAIDQKRIFATGHSWGGDMAAVAGCFLGNRFRAIAPVAAHRPYWFKTPPDTSLCKGKPDVWTFFGRKDDWFADASPDGQFGIEQNDFWRRRLNCSGASKLSGETNQYTHCAADLRFTLYAPGQYSGSGKHLGHQPPDTFMPMVAKWLSGF
jgi:polyhydroxybutyrate depolymerase